MKHIRNFNSYKEKRFNDTINLFKGIEFNNNDLQLFKDVFEKLLKNYKVEESIKQEIRNYIEETNMINEGFFDKLKERFPKAAEVSKKLSDKAEGVLNKVLQASKDAISFVKNIGKGIRELFINVINSSKKFFEEQIKGGKLKEKITELASSKKEGLKKDLVEIKKVLEFYRKDFLSKLISSKEKNMTDFLQKEQEPVVESLILEKGNVIATFVHRIEEYAPFSWLHKIAQAGEAGANQFIKSLSDLTSKMGGPSFTLPVVALIVGVAFEHIVKSEAGGWLINLAGATTPFGMAITGMKMIASFIALLTIIDGIVGEKILGGHDHGHEKQEAPEKSEQEKSDE